MKTKQTYMKAVFSGKRGDNAKGSESNHNLWTEYKIIDKKSERTIVVCRVYSKGSGNTAYASLWVHKIADANKPEGWEYGETSGSGNAGGYGYHKESAAVAGAIRSAGIELFGSPYGHPVNKETPADTRKLLKYHAHIAGCGTGSIECALCAIAYAAGFNNVIFVR